MKTPIFAALVALSLTVALGCEPSSELTDPDLVGASSKASLTTTPFPGIEYITGETARPAQYFAVKIDLSAPGIKVMTTRPADRKRTVSDFAEEYHCTVALNGDFFSYETYDTVGLAIGGGEKWPNSSDGPSWGFAAFGADNRAMISPPSEVVNPVPDWIVSAVGGYPLVLEDGEPLEPTSCAPHFCQPNPRSAVGLSQDQKTLFLLAIDGRSSVSKGATTVEVGQVLKQLGAWRGLNLDGGGSTALYVKGTGIVNTPSDHSERLVANHIGICDG